MPLTYEQRQAYACKICQNVPDECGWLGHGRGCYVVSADGGGDTFVEFAEEDEPMKLVDFTKPIRLCGAFEGVSSPRVLTQESVNPPLTCGQTRCVGYDYNGVTVAVWCDEFGMNDGKR